MSHSLLRVSIPLVAVVIASGCKDAAAPLIPATVTARTSAILTDTVGLRVSPSPSVKVEDASGSPIPGVTVTFGVTSGGGSVVGASAVTNAEGLASVINWRLGPGRGEQTLAASVDGLTPVIFHAKAIAGSPYSMRRIAGDGQTVDAGTPVPIRPSVLLQDLYGNPVSNVTVTFEGDGVAGGTQVTDESGTATVGGWAPGGAGLGSLEVRSGFLFNRFNLTIR